MRDQWDKYANPGRRSPSGERGLKLDVRNITRDDGRRSPSGERGLKFEYVYGDCDFDYGRSPSGLIMVAPHPGSVD
ncbi:hypothetical protein B5786_0527 [Bifidobacterium breve]|nr:hypothetical protein B5786_0527 [Bifidobacterium breve]